MKLNRFGVIGLGLVLLAGAAFAVNVVEDSARKWFSNGIYIGARSANPSGSTRNLITGAPGARCDYDYPAIGGTSTSLVALAAYSFPCTVDGAKVGDPCFAGSIEGADGGVGTGDGGNPFRQEIILTCNVTAPGVVKGRVAALMSDGGSIDLPDASYFYRVISSQ